MSAIEHFLKMYFKSTNKKLIMNIFPSLEKQSNKKKNIILFKRFVN